MSRSRVAGLGVVPAVLLVHAGLVACGSDEPSANPPESPSETSASQGTDGPTEPITEHGVAAVVRDVLGAHNVESFGTYPAGGGQASVMVTLSEGDPRDMFAVSVSASADSVLEGSGCEDSTDMGSCEELADGRIVISQLVDSGFSDDNPEGVVVYATAEAPDGSGANALYESYDDEPPVTAEQLAALLGDPRLTWKTAPTTNEAGADVDIEELTG